MAAIPALPPKVKHTVRGLRVAGSFATLLAVLLMAFSTVRSHDTLTFYNQIVVKVHYNELEVFKAFFIANIIATCYGFVVAILPEKSLLWVTFMVADVMWLGMLSGLDSAAMAVAYLHKNGDSQAFWPPICSQVSSYCNFIYVSITAGLLGALIFLVLVVHHIVVLLNPFLEQ